MKTADGTKDGTGRGDRQRRAPTTATRPATSFSGPEYLTVFNGQTGKAMATADYVPARGTVSSWGDTYGNRVDRFLAGTAYVDGSRPSIIMARGYYTRSVIAAWDYRNGALTRRWTFDSNSSTQRLGLDRPGQPPAVRRRRRRRRPDEILYGAMAIDDNGAGLWKNGQGHGMLKVDEDTSKLAAWMADARTGAIIWSNPSCNCDNGRGVSGGPPRRHRTPAGRQPVRVRLTA